MAMTTTTRSNSRSHRSSQSTWAGATRLSLVAFCGTIAFFSKANSRDERSPSSAIEPYHPPPPSSASLPYSFSIAKINDGPRGLSRGDRRRRLSEALPDGGCKLTWPVKPGPGIQITYAASYPGCGARMLWNLVEALTGMWTGDDWNNNGRGEDVVTVKTHYPQSNGILVDFDERITRAFFIIRNPSKSIPSFFNHIYEMRNHLPVHSERAPVGEWIKWRNAYLDIEIAEYKKFICYWMDRYTPENRLLISYEGITDDVIGPEVAKGLNEFLGRAEGVTTIDRESVPCIWRAVVKNEPPPEQKAQIEKLQALAVNQPQGQPPVVQAPQHHLVEVPQQQVEVPQQQVEVPQQQVEVPQQKVPQQQDLQPIGQQPVDPVAYADMDALDPQLQQPQETVPQQQPGVRRRLDLGHHDSQRKGPDVPRPYTPEQQEKMMNMLLEVAQRYHHEDVRLYHILMGYYEQIRQEKEG